MTLVDNAVYVNGHRSADPKSLDETYQLLREREGLAWIGLCRPDLEEIRSVATEFDLHDLAVEDAVTAHQRPKIERYGNTLFVVLRPARYLDDVEKVEFGELHVFLGKEFVVTVRHAESPDLAKVRRRLEANPRLLCMGPEAVLYAILDQVVDEYDPVVAGLENDIDEIENQLFNENAAVSRRIYELSGKSSRCSAPRMRSAISCKRCNTASTSTPSISSYSATCVTYSITCCGSSTAWTRSGPSCTVR